MLVLGLDRNEKPNNSAYSQSAFFPFCFVLIQIDLGHGGNWSPGQVKNRLTETSLILKTGEKGTALYRVFFPENGGIHTVIGIFAI